MENEKNADKPATEIPVFTVTTEVLGLNLRRFYAAHALQGQAMLMAVAVANQSMDVVPEREIALAAFRIADAMIAAEKEGQ